VNAFVWVTVTVPGPAQAPAVFTVNAVVQGVDAPVLSVHSKNHETAS